MIRSGSLCVMLALSASLTLGCARYHIGSRTLYRPDVQTVHVPIFESASYRRGLGERITEAVIKEIESNTPYKVVSAEMADSVLKGRLTNDRKLTRAVNSYDEPRILDAELNIQYTWTDRRGELLRQPAYLDISPQLLGATELSTGTFFPEVGQSITTAQEEAIRKFAAQVVLKMQTPW
ncbi:MAG: hypothetical protein COA78_05220 [Blastopirellula sp.]|nr:MAG: hypothetical protein COA78_05220 [Blastopirellula sp.]